eukprot:3941574-Rhodomonas_salina.2
MSVRQSWYRDTASQYRTRCTRRVARYKPQFQYQECGFLYLISGCIHRRQARGGRYRNLNEVEAFVKWRLKLFDGDVAWSRHTLG